MKQEFKISYSRINTYLFCPYKYKLIYLKDIRIPINADITFGHIIHRTLENFHRHNNSSYDNLMDFYDNSWKNDGFINPQQVFEYYIRGKNMLIDYYRSFCNSKAEVLYVEKEFNSTIGKYKFIGIIDRIDKCPNNIYEVIDYKTHIKIWSQKKIDENLQLSFYAYACKNVFGLNPNRIAVYFLSINRKIYTERSNEKIAKAIDLAMQTAENIEVENFNPDTSKCWLCDFKLKCKYSKYN
ncbi:MAG: PD-(D/E)XK nuclease family protein [Endomicrobium sp.]|jgi:ATP-dependent helicase/DNAse subunit B|nr:PD-(D/E)XK nuclease family protein [Endomicrobium sp.]